MLLKQIAQQTLPIRSSVNLITPVLIGKNTVKRFGGKVIDENHIRVTRSKYFFLRWTPKLLLDIRAKEAEINLTFRPAIFTTIVLFYSILILIGAFVGLLRGNTAEIIFGIVQFAIVIFLIGIEINIYMKMIKQIVAKNEHHT